MSARQRRQGTRMCVKREMDKISSIIQEETTVGIDVTQLELSLAKLVAYQTKFEAADNAVLAEVTDPAKIDAEILEAAEYNDDVLETISRAKIVLEKVSNLSKSTATARKSGGSGPGESKSCQLKLPKLEISPFSGETLDWQSFWDSFESAVHNNGSLSVIDKFNYLRNLLTGDALNPIKGYRLTADNYDAVVSTLKERFGDKQVAIFAHFEAMLSLPQASYDVTQLQSVCDDCERHIRSLVALGLDESTFGQVFTPILLSKLPKDVKVELHWKNGSQRWSLTNLREWLKDEIRARQQGQRVFGESRSGASSSQKGSKIEAKDQQHAALSQQPVKKPASNASASALVSTSNGKKKCAYCGKDHYSDQCTKYGDVTARRAKLQNNCLSCLGTGHRVKDCNRKVPCAHCQKTGHHRSLCFTKFGSKDGKSTTEKAAECGMNVDAAPFQSKSKRTIMQTAVATLANMEGSHSSSARLLFDTAGSRSFITEQKQIELGLSVVGEESVSIAGFRSKKRRTSSYKIVEFVVRCLDGSSQVVSASVVPSITCPIQKIPLDPTLFPALKNITLSEPLVTEPELVGIDVLVGLDFYHDFVGIQRIQCDNGPLLLESRLGYIATGRVATTATGSETIAVMLLNEAPSIIPNSNFDVEKYWNLEDIGMKESTTYNVGDDEAVRFHSETLKRDGSGRYFSRWPWRNNDHDLPDNFQVAFGRLKSLLRQLNQNPELFQKYGQIIADQLEKGIIEQVDPAVQTPNPVYYMPHHCVVTPSKSTTKVRVVYDASSKSRKDIPSLNDCLHRGPVIMEDLCGLLIRFRLKKVGLVSDIEKAFLQVGLQESDRDVTRFLWVVDVSKPPVGSNMLVFRFCRVPFGIIASSFALENTVCQHLIATATPVAKNMLNDHYVDNVITGEDDSETAVAHYHEAKSIFSTAQMNLREWYTNDDDVRSKIAPADQGLDKEPKVLGLRWDVAADALYCEVPSTITTENVTKRSVLREIARVFDPLGWFSPITVSGKMFVQNLWKAGYSWDEVLPESMQAAWMKIVNNLSRIPELKMPRFMCSIVEAGVQLHVFCDASAKACAAAVFLRVVSGDNVVCQLVMFKTRLAPVKHCPTIPRLELIAAVIGCRLLSFVRGQLKIDIGEFYLWTDSQCTLHWIKNQKVYAPFVKHRVEEIRKQADVECRYVPSSQNPADLPSRGCDIDTLQNSEIWQHGPIFLRDATSKWPEFDEIQAIEEEQVCISSELKPPPEGIVDESRFSSLSRLIRTTAFVLRFAGNARKPQSERKFGVLSTEELIQGRIYWYRLVQRKHFHDLVSFQGAVWPKGIGTQLNLFRDSEGILRSCGRIEAADVGYDMKYPILLPKTSHFTDLVVKDAHAKLLHSGVAQTLAEVRKRFWIIKGRSVVRRIRRNCKHCRKFEGGAYHVPDVPSLPSARVAEAPPFTYVGLDYMGPLFVKTGDGSKVKVWICLYTCMVVRAVFLDVVDDLSAEQFLLSLRRFISVYGLPLQILSDNASQFRRVQKFVGKEWMTLTRSDRVQDFAAAKGIRWSFIVEFAPWMGGFYERLVGIVKRSLRKALDSCSVTSSELRTVVSEITAVVKSRPLTYLDDDRDSMSLTPAHFLANHQVCHLPQSTLSDDADFVPSSSQPDLLAAKWKRLQGVVQRFWDSWRHEYLAGLRERHVAHQQRNCSDTVPAVNSVVQIKDNVPRMQWKLGRIMKLHISKDNKVRSAAVRLANGRILNRPLKLLFPLEADGTNDIDVIPPTADPGDIVPVPRRPQRQAAIDANRKINSQLKDDNSSQN